MRLHQLLMFSIIFLSLVFPTLTKGLDQFGGHCLLAPLEQQHTIRSVFFYLEINLCRAKRSFIAYHSVTVSIFILYVLF